MSEVRCYACGKQQQILKRCTRCQSVYYCSRDCQVKNWPSHKQDCRDIQTRTGRPDATSEKGATWTDNKGNKDIWAEMSAASDEARFVGDAQNTVTRPTRTIRVNFQGAVDAVSSLTQASDLSKAQAGKASATGVNDPAVKPSRFYVDNNNLFYDVPAIDPAKPVTSILVKANKKKLSIDVHDHWNGIEILKAIAHATEIPLNALKLIHKGQFATENNITRFIKRKALFQAIGERAENEEGVYHDDIEVLMNQCSVSRNEAIKALKKNGDLIDAILEIGNK